jgi:ribosomal protein S12 methylthiotransferase accessory factor
MLKNPRLKYCYSARFLDDDKVLLMSEKDKTLLVGKLYQEVLYEIQHNSLSLEELMEKLEGKVPALDLLYALEVLEKDGYITEAAPALTQEVCAYWHNQGIEVNSLLKILQEKKISIDTIGPLSPGVFLDSFASVGVKTAETGVLKVIVTDDYGRSELRRINQEAMTTGRPWMLVKPVGVELWLGPIFIPGQTGCWECLQQRLDFNRPLDTFYKAQKNTDDIIPIPIACLTPSLQIAASHTAIEIVKWLYAGKNERLEGKIVVIDTQSLSCQSHVLVKRPQCQTCGEPGYKPEPMPITLNKKSSPCETNLGGYREISPGDTIEKYQYHVSPITGVIPKLTPYFSIKGAPVYNYSSGKNLALMSKTLFWLNLTIRSGNGGKGKTREQAKAGALCEALERYSLTYHGDEPYIISSLKQLGNDGIHPNACMNFSETQYQNREAINRDSAKFYTLVPVPFDESLEMHWTPVYSLTGKEFKYLPSCYCYAQYPAEDELNLFSYPDSNGCAAGNSLEEAILQGFLELVERDGTALWWYNMVRKPAVDLLSFNEPYFLKLIEYYRSLQRSLYLLDLTTDLGIPTFAAISHRLDDKRENIIFGFGAHTDAQIAVERALVELNQILPIVNVSEADRAQGKYLTRDKNFVHWLNNATLENQPYLEPIRKVLGFYATSSDR